jgi:hypothetical protein
MDGRATSHVSMLQGICLTKRAILSSVESQEKCDDDGYIHIESQWIEEKKKPQQSVSMHMHRVRQIGLQIEYMSM